MLQFSSVQFSQSLSHVRLFVTPWIAACQASLSITNSRSLLKFMSIKSVMPSSHLILCRPLLLLPPIPPSIKAFSNESTLRMRWPKYWSFSFSIIPSTRAIVFTESYSMSGMLPKPGIIKMKEIKSLLYHGIRDLPVVRNRLNQIISVWDAR